MGIDITRRNPTTSRLIPFPIRLVIAIAITVILMTYVIMPLLTKLLKSWLFKT